MQPPPLADGFRRIKMLVHRAVRDGLEIPHKRRISGDVQDARPRLALRFDRRIARIDHRHAIDGERVFPHARLDWSDGRTPFAALAFGHHGAAGKTLPGDAHLVGLRRLEPER